MTNEVMIIASQAEMKRWGMEMPTVITDECRQLTRKVMDASHVIVIPEEIPDLIS